MSPPRVSYWNLTKVQQARANILIAAGMKRHDAAALVYFADLQVA